MKKTVEAIKYTNTKTAPMGNITLNVGDKVYVAGVYARNMAGTIDGRVDYIIDGFTYKDNGDIQFIKVSSRYADCRSTIELLPEDFGRKFFIELPSGEWADTMTYKKCELEVENGDDTDECKESR